jgi:EAL domain-containing protein (putative c-di-GMP-specific phosphodiesterase class I)
MTLDYLVIEINENLTRDKCRNLKDKLKMYQQAGVQVAIDSFGDHYLSLRQLKTLPFKIIKLSQGSLHDALSDEEGLTSYKRLVKLVKELNLTIIQEGVEAVEEVDLTYFRKKSPSSSV